MLAFFLCIFPSSSSAIGNLRLGGTQLHPSITLSHAYDDNIYLDDDNKVDDSLTLISPMIELKRIHDESTFLLSYDAHIYRYSNKIKEDRETHTGTAFINTRFPGGLKLKLRDTYIQTAEPASSETTKTYDRMQNQFEVAMASNVFDRLSFELSYRGLKHDYKEDINDPDLEKHDRLEETYGAEFLLKLLPKTSFFLEYNTGQIVYDTVILLDERDSTFNTYGIGLKGQITSKLNLDIMGGYTDRDYESPAKADFRRKVASLLIHYDFSSFLKFSVKGERKIEESFFVEKITGNSSNSYADSRVSLNIDYKITYKVSVNLDSYYGVNDYPGKVDRKDNLSGIDLNLKYNIKPWLSTGVGYAYQERDSSLDPLLYSVDYQDNRYNINLSATF